MVIGSGEGLITVDEDGYVAGDQRDIAVVGDLVVGFDEAHARFAGSSSGSENLCPDVLIARTQARLQELLEQEAAFSILSETVEL